MSFADTMADSLAKARHEALMAEVERLEFALMCERRGSAELESHRDALATENQQLRAALAVTQALLDRELATNCERDSPEPRNRANPDENGAAQ